MDIENIIALFIIILMGCVFAYWVVKHEASEDTHEHLETSQKNKQRLDEAIKEVEKHNNH
ncbi:hypothetical protein [Methylophaga sp.]|uniref:hypothetical protein n=1 Tax=Methylophaga sp. TaxID=2024840 RepID=UPI003A92DFEC